MTQKQSDMDVGIAGEGDADSAVSEGRTTESDGGQNLAGRAALAGTTSHESRPLLALLIAQVGWMAVAGGLLLVLGEFSYELYFAVSFIGFLINKFLVRPSGRSPRYWWVVTLLTVIGFVLLVYQVALRIQAVLAAA